MKMNKKGLSLNDMYPAVLTIVLIGIILGIGLYTLDKVAEGVASETIAITNETVHLGTSPVSVATVGDCKARTFTLVGILNGTTNATVPANNYTFSTAGLLTGTSGENINNDSDTFFSYTYVGTPYTGTTDACESLGTAVTSTGGFANWIAVIVVVLAAAIILGIVISSFGKRSAT